MCKSSTNLIRMLQKYGYLSYSVKHSPITTSYGPCGCLLRDNIHREWRKHFLLSLDTEGFPFEVGGTVEGPPFGSSPPALQNSLADAYAAAKELTDPSGPFGLVHSIRYRSPGTTTASAVQTPGTPESDVHKAIAYPEHWTLQQFAFFTPQPKLFYWFAYWQRERLKWWRKFSKCPSDFSLTEVSENSDGDDSGAAVSIVRKLPWGGTEPVEHIRIAPSSEGDGQIQRVILCDSSVELTAATYVSDGLSRSDNNGRTVLRLHHKLTPYKATIATTIPSLRPLASLLQIQLKRAKVAIYPNPLLGTQTPLDTQITRFDEMGVFLTVVLNENTQKTGVAYVRNRDTTIKEQIHVTEIRKKLPLYLQTSDTEPEFS